MSNSLYGQTPKDTYPALIKVGDNTNVTTVNKILSDGQGNDLPIEVSTTQINFTNEVKKNNVDIATINDIDIQKYKIITGDITIDNTFHNTITTITANSVITFPSGLRDDLAFVCDVNTGISGTLVAGSGVTIDTNGDGTSYASKSMFSVTTSGTNKFRFKGQLS